MKLDLEKYRQDIPESLGHIVMRTLVKNLTKRFQTGLQLASELNASFDNLKFLDEEINSKEKLNALKKQFFSRILIPVNYYPKSLFDTSQIGL